MDYFLFIYCPKDDLYVMIQCFGCIIIRDLTGKKHSVSNGTRFDGTYFSVGW